MVGSQIIAIHLEADADVISTRQNVGYWHGATHVIAVYA
jgi:hypothetical protein